MRFLSRATSFKRAAIKSDSTLVHTDRGPARLTTREPYIATFTPGGATEAELALAVERFGDKVLGDNPAKQVSTFDTDELAEREGWSPDFKKAVEKGLLTGQGQHYFLVSESAPATPPWPAYDKANPKKIVETAFLIGVELDEVLAYERGSKNRPAVVAAIEAAMDEVEIVA